ncbi:MAG: hypothetical protein RBJ76_05855 [Stenomitos frigidus ULC029]
MTTETKTPTVSDLKAAIAQAVQDQQQALDAAAQAETQVRQQAETLALETFKLPFDGETIALLPPLTYKCKSYNDKPEPIACFEFEGLTITSQRTTYSGNVIPWLVSAYQEEKLLCSRLLNVYEDSSKRARSPEDLGQQLLVFLHESVERLQVQQQRAAAPPQETGTYEDFRATQKQRAQFIKAAMQGTLIGLTSTGLEAKACLQAALFAVETAEQVLTVMQATPLQRQVLGVLTLERFTEWLRKYHTQTIVGSLANEDHPLYRYLSERCPEALNAYDLALDDDGRACLLGKESDHGIAKMVTLETVGKWLPALLNWKTDAVNEGDPIPTFSAGEVLTFLEPYQR